VKKIHRRDCLKSGTAVLATAIATGVVGEAAAAEETASTAPKRLAMVIDLSRCTGCNACTVACKAENGIRLGAFRAWVSETEKGRYPRVTRHFLPRLCNQCDNPPCLRVCPTGATYRRDDGLVDIEKTKCIGCRHCMAACPYNSRYFSPGPIREDSESHAGTPGTVDKCNFCAHRVDNGLVPACVNTCPTNARIFGDLDDPESEVHRLVARGKAETLLPEFGTGPAVFYVGGDPRIFEGG
jgi:tetrathionate reductase subunit B